MGQSALLMPPGVAATVATYPRQARAYLGTLRALIFDEAERLNAGSLTETLKWGEPAYLTEATKAGTTVRLAWKSRKPDHLRLLVHCQTTLVDTWRARFPELQYEGNRAVLLPLAEALPEPALRVCIAMALRYHRGET